MKVRLPSALAVCTVLALLAACGGSSSPDEGTDARLDDADHVLVMERASLVPPSRAMLRSLGIEVSGTLRRRYGGQGTAQAVDLQLDWLSRHQVPEDGYWDAVEFREQCIGEICDGTGAKNATNAVTGLALLYYLGAGYTHQAGKYKKQVANTIKYLKRIQTPDGCFGPKTGPYLYGHATCTLAILEAYGMSSSPLLLGPAEKAVAYLLGAQNRAADGATRTAWGERAGVRHNHLAVTTWALLALRSAGRVGLEIPGDAVPGAKAWLLSVIDSESALVLPEAEPPAGDMPRSSIEARAAMGAFALMLAGEDPASSPLLRAASAAINRRIGLILDDQGRASDDLAWYFGTLAQFRVGGPAWKTWNRALRAAVVRRVKGCKCPSASWAPRGSWAAFGGRIHTYALLGMATQAYYRYGKTVGLRSGGTFTPEAAALAPAAPGAGALRAVGAGLPSSARFPLEHTDVEAEVSAWLATTEVTQTFGNPFRRTVEAIYTFPLPTRAAVSDFVMEIAGRRIVGVIRPRAEARRIYRRARALGKTASLLTQERPNVFTQHVANIEPGGRVDVRITYFEPLTYRDGGYEYVFPMVVGPRYIPGNPRAARAAPRPKDAPAPGGGVAADTDQVPDASRIAPPVLPEGHRSGHDIDFRLTLRAGVPIGAVSSPTHDISVRSTGTEGAVVELNPHDTIPNRDLVVRWRVAGRATRAGVLAHRGTEGAGYFTAFLLPGLDPSDADVSPREVTFVLDNSGSMDGVPIAAAKRLIRRALLGLRGVDRFNVICFAGSSRALAPAPLANSDTHRRRALAFLEDARAGGGTEMLAGIQTWLAQPRDPRYVRYVCFLTDGFVGNDDAILAAVKRSGTGARWFAFGIGSSVNRYLIEGIGRFGGGASRVVLTRERAAAEHAADEFLRTLDAPTLVDVTVDTGDLPIADIYPRRLPDLTLGAPVLLTGRYRGPAAGDLVFRGRVGGRKVAIHLPIRLPAAESMNAGLAAIWARGRIADLTASAIGASADRTEELRGKIVETALAHRLMSKYTAFTAVDETRIVGRGLPTRIVQPVELPEGVNRETTVGRPAKGVPLRVAAWGLTVTEGADLSLRVTSVDPDGVAERAGVRPGEHVVAVGRNALLGSRHLEALLWQQTGKRVRLGLVPGIMKAADATEVRCVSLPTP